MDAGDGVTRHVMVGFFDPADGNQAETAAVSQTAATAGGAATTTAGPFGARLALDAGDDDGVTRHVMVGFFDLADGNQAEATAVSQAARPPAEPPRPQPGL